MTNLVVTYRGSGCRESPHRPCVEPTRGVALMQTKMTRREFLRWAGLAGVGAWLAACRPSAPTPAPLPTPTPLPTSVPTPALPREALDLIGRALQTSGELAVVLVRQAAAILLQSGSALVRAAARDLQNADTGSIKYLAEAWSLLVCMADVADDSCLELLKLSVTTLWSAIQWIAEHAPLVRDVFVTCKASHDPRTQRAEFLACLDAGLREKAGAEYDASDLAVLLRRFLEVLRQGVGQGAQCVVGLLDCIIVWLERHL